MEKANFVLSSFTKEADFSGAPDNLMIVVLT